MATDVDAWVCHGTLNFAIDVDGCPKTINSLLIENLQRDDLHSILTCQASNNNISNPVSTSVKIDMHCRYLCWFAQKIYFPFQSVH